MTAWPPWFDGASRIETDYVVTVDLSRRTVRMAIDTELTLVLTPARARHLQHAIAQALTALGEEKE